MADEKFSFKDALDSAADKLAERSGDLGIALADVHRDVQFEAAPETNEPDPLAETDEVEASPELEPEPVEDEPKTEEPADEDNDADLDAEIARLEAEMQAAKQPQPAAQQYEPKPDPPQLPPVKPQIDDKASFDIDESSLTSSEKALLTQLKAQQAELQRLKSFQGELQRQREEQARQQAIKTLIDRTMQHTEKYGDVYTGPFGELAKQEVIRRLHVTDESEPLIVARVAKQYREAERQQRKTYLETKIKQQRGRVVKRGGSAAAASAAKKQAAPSGRDLTTGALVERIASRL